MSNDQGLLLEPESILVSEFTSYGAPPRARIYSLLVTSRRETHRIQGLVYLFTLQGSGQAPLWYTLEKITVPKAWFTGSTCLALASSLEYILEVFLFYFFYSCERETHRIQGLVYLFTLQGSGQAPLWYTPEKITVPKAWFTGSTCLALASSLEYILEVFLFYFSASFQNLVGFQLRETSLNPESIITTRN
ncbi:hypothetical protein EVAR_79483_1 [Eumeta japonica]|uniref:Uncharacterized protein n=1 Tax=Eumeta variegata TaxID=151549 RepID=A0A4C1UF75_EUMVA|nr:hypothetical protein EVAR_79483_1 [Eumeta japonica]